MLARGEIVTIGCEDHRSCFAMNTHRIVVIEDRPDAFVAVSEGNWFRTEGKMKPCTYPKFAWEVRP